MKRFSVALLLLLLFHAPALAQIGEVERRSASVLSNGAFIGWEAGGSGGFQTSATEGTTVKGKIYDTDLGAYVDAYVMYVLDEPIMDFDSDYFRLDGEPITHIIGDTLEAYADLEVPSADVISILNADNFAAIRTLLSLTIGVNVQGYDTELAALASTTSAADRLPYFTGSGTASVATFTAAARDLVDDANAAAMRQTLLAARLAVYDIREYATGGAGIANDGVDDQAAYLAAVAAADAAGGGIIYLPAGTWNVNNSFYSVGNDNIHVRGDGPGATILVTDTSLSSVGFGVGESSTAVIFFAQCSNCSVADLTIDKTAQTQSGMNGIAFLNDLGEAYRGTNNTVQNVVVNSANVYSYMVFMQGCNRSRILDSTIDGGLNGTPAGGVQPSPEGFEFFDCEKCVMDNCIATNFESAGFMLFYANRDCVISKWQAENCFNAVSLTEEISVPAAETYGISIIDGKAVSCPGRTISVIGDPKEDILIGYNKIIGGGAEGQLSLFGGDDLNRNFLVVGNQFTGSEDTDGAALIAFNFRGCDLINNQFDDCPFQSVRLVSCLDMSIQGGSMTNGAQAGAGANHIGLFGGDRITIDGVRIGDTIVDGPCVNVSGATDTVICNLSIHRTSGTASFNPIWITGSTRATASNNFVSSGSTFLPGPYLVSTSTGVVIDHTNPPQRISTASPTLIPYTSYVYTGSGTTWTLPTAGSSFDAPIWQEFKNAGTGTLIISRGGSETIFDRVADETSFFLFPGESRRVAWNGTNWTSNRDETFFQHGATVNHIEQRNGTTDQSWSIFDDYTNGGTDSRRFEFFWQGGTCYGFTRAEGATSGGPLTLGTEDPFSLFFYTNAVLQVWIDENGVFRTLKSSVFNEFGEDFDTRIEGLDDDFLLFVDASENRVGINDDTPDYKLDVEGTLGVTGTATFSSGIVMGVGQTLTVPAGSNRRAGNATLVAGTIDVANTTVTADTIIILSRKTIGGTPGNLTYVLDAGTKFTINSSEAADTSVVSYLLIESP